MEQGLISIIVPVYNVEEYIDKCLESLLGQTYQNIEIICVDDGSTDSSINKLDTYAKKDSRVRSFTQKNSGVSNARNKGLDNMRGEFFAFVDPDDYIESDMYEQLFLAIQKENADIASCSYSIVQDRKIDVMRNLSSVKQDTMPAKKFLKYIYKRDRHKAVGGYVWTRLFRRKSFQDYGIRFHEDVKYGEGTLFLAECMVIAKTVIYIDKPLYYYVQRNKSALHDRQQVLKNSGSLKAYREMIELFKKEEINWYIIILLKRFYVYNASVLMEYCHELNQLDYKESIKVEMKRYMPEYIFTNLNRPSRLIRIFNLLK